MSDELLEPFWRSFASEKKRTTANTGVQTLMVPVGGEMIAMRIPNKKARMTIAIHRLTVEELKDVLRREGRSTIGTKDLLTQRLLTVDLERLGPDDETVMKLFGLSCGGIDIPKLAFVDWRVADNVITFGAAT